MLTFAERFTRPVYTLSGPRIDRFPVPLPPEVERTRRISRVSSLHSTDDDYPWSPARRYIGVEPERQDHRGHDIPYAVIVGSAVPWNVTPIQAQSEVHLYHLSLQSYPDEDPLLPRLRFTQTLKLKLYGAHSKDSGHWEAETRREEMGAG
ncbi:hypothetical protein BDN72DRAFT_963256 [Pluteus cervinus]|uniref:Uncharacterized protein n=1 Tax=Pluteus cervinus TaxID=181527 RepID=A0ACD3AHN3_9AGAR|nr:hypothetical protein BDN72DRAFT_963256 [Pluteus cervinus]